MAESESEPQKYELPDEVIQAWTDALSLTRRQFEIDANDPVSGMMDTLADLSNRCFEHFVRLWLYQQHINAVVEERKEEAPSMGKFSSNLPST